MTLKIDKSWTLFLDRDGVINHRIEDDFVLEWVEFKYHKKADEAIAKLKNFFNCIVVVTNQRCVDEGELLESDLIQMHDTFVDDIKSKGGRIDKVFYCPHTKEAKCKCRKPEVGMALQAKKLFPHIDFSKSIMVGDSLSDMDFGKKMGMITVLIKSKNIPYDSFLVDFAFESLWDFEYHLNLEHSKKS